MQSVHSIVALSGTLALGFLLVVLAVALYGSWMPLPAAALFALAQLPQAPRPHDPFDEAPTARGGSFVSAFLLTSGVALPLALAHAGCLAPPAAGLTLAGGAAIFASIAAFSASFAGPSL